MKNPEINIVKKISEEHKKLLFFAPIAIVILVIIGYLIFNPAKNENITANQNNNWKLPVDAQEDMPNKTTDIINEYNKDAEKKASDANRDFFGDLDNYNLDKNEKTPGMSSKDSLYLVLQQQLKDINNKNAYKQKKPYQSQKEKKATQVVVVKEEPKVVENEIDVNDFFNNKVKVEKKEEVNENILKTDEAIYAVIHNDQTIKNKERLKLRLSKPATINGVIFKKNTFIYGFTSFSKNRVNVNITNINNIPVDLIAYDSQDGNIGVYVKGANISGDISQETTNDAIDEMDASEIPLGNTIKNVFKKKARESKVSLLNNYQVILKPNL